MRRSLWILLLGLVFSGSVRGETYPWSDREAHFRAAAQQTPASDAVPIWKNLEYKGRHFRVAATMLSAHAELVDLLLKTESMDDTEQQYWFDLYPSMEARQIDRLYEILRTERQKLAALDAKYAEEIRLLQADRPVPEEPAPFSERTTELGLVFVRLPGGRFRMGCDDPNAKGNAECWSDEKWSDGKAQHEVEISAPFWLGKYEVTQKQWRAVMGDEPMQQGNSRSAFLGDDKPVGYVSYNRILEFIDRLNAREGRDGSAGRERYRLPTEAEWEYAARAGTQTPWSCGSNARCLNEMGARF
ncbi:MAG: formylglycine-generating enzyme family protein, partial [Zoogloeaceae bacterium]|nr:formylglycine-generating enzyme family protein [Zoogloeaceae bacterium]